MSRRIIDTMVTPSRSRENSFTLSPQQIHCICQKNFQKNNNFMVGCDMCLKWYHTKCIDSDDGLADIADYFHCTSCIEKKFKPMLNYWCHIQQKKINNGIKSLSQMKPAFSQTQVYQILIRAVG